MREEGTRRRGSETGAETEPAMTFGMAEEATIALAGDNRTCSDGGSREDKCSSSKGSRTRSKDSSEKRFFHDGS